MKTEERQVEQEEEEGEGGRHQRQKKWGGSRNRFLGIALHIEIAFRTSLQVVLASVAPWLCSVFLLVRHHWILLLLPRNNRLSIAQ